MADTKPEKKDDEKGSPVSTEPPYAHSAPEGQPWEPLFTESCRALNGKHCEACESMAPTHGHLNKVAWHTANFAAQMFPEGPDRDTAKQWGYLAGLWHDLGKFAPEWQKYLKSKADPHIADVSGVVDHSTAGAVHTEILKSCGQLMSYVIAGHHAGLADGPKLFFADGRLKKKIHQWKDEAANMGVPLDLPIPLPPLTRPAGNDAMAFMLRFFFSCLVDSDFLATESFMNSRQAEQRTPWPVDTIDQMIGSLDLYFERKFGNDQESQTTVNRARNNVRDACGAAANSPTGFFSLTVPTGGGKTLSSLLFALRHARANNLRRVILVIPFTSIIKQNADVFRDAFADLSKSLGREIVLEHHTKFDPAKETTANRLSSENWDSPLIVTTNVRFFESLFANRTSACRKLHRIARSVVVFDEVQALPYHLLTPILRGLTCLVKDFHSTAVLCTATQPALEKRGEFTVGIPSEEITPIIHNEAKLFETLKRVESHYLGAIDDDELIAHILENAADGCLLIVNTTKAAQILHEKLSKHTNALHLSARMCPAHVIATLNQAKELREKNHPLVLVSTQLIEAGVDISFPVVYRAECGLDSFAQAAGRCNRNAELVDSNGVPLPGHVYYIEPIDHPIPGVLTDINSAAAVTRDHIVPNFDPADLLSIDAVRAYFEQAIWQAGPKTNNWDKPNIVSGDMACFAPESKSLTAYQFKTAAEKFRLIPSATHAVIVPWGNEGKKLCKELRTLHEIKRPPSRKHFRLAQQFTVQVYDNEWKQMQHKLEHLSEDTFHLLIHPENDYDKTTGLKRPDAPDDPSAFIA
jgi:CRISPR-associated endonuclease/helicase Cas3